MGQIWHFLRLIWAKLYLNRSCPRIVPFGTNLTQSDAIFDIPELDLELITNYPAYHQPAIVHCNRGDHWSRWKPQITNGHYGQLSDQIWAQRWSDWPQMRQIRDFFRSNSVHFGSPSQNVLNLIWKKSRICPIWGQSDPLWGLAGHLDVEIQDKCISIHHGVIEMFIQLFISLR